MAGDTNQATQPTGDTAAMSNANPDEVRNQPTTNPNGQAGPAPTQTQPTQNQTPQPMPARPEDQHAGVFRQVLSTLAGGSRQPVVDANGNPVADATGRVQTQIAPKKALGLSILAGAISGMMSGYAEGAPRRTGTGIVATNPGAALKAGEEAGDQASMKNRVQKAQNVSDEQRLRQYQTMKQNLDLHAMALNASKASDEVVKENLAHFAPIASALQNDPDLAKLVAGQDENEADLQKRIKSSGGDVTRDSAIPTSSRPEIGPDGKPTGRLETLWTSFHNGGKVTLTDDMIKEYGLNGVRPGVQIPVSTLVQQALNKSHSTLAQSALQGVVDKQNEMLKGQGQKPITFDWDAIKKQAPYVRQYEQQVAGLAGLDPDQFIAGLNKIDPSGGLAGAVQSQMHVDLGGAWADQRATNLKAAQESTNPDKQILAPQDVADLRKNVSKMYPKLPIDQLNAALIGLGPTPNQGDVSKAMDRIQKMEENRVNALINQEKLDDKKAQENLGGDILTMPDATGFVPGANFPGGVKEYNKRQNAMKKNVDDLTKMDGTFSQFESILDDIKNGKDISGAQSVVALFNAIGISAQPLAGKGFRINNNTVQEHAEARGLGQSLYQKFLSLKNGDVITPQQIADYANIALETRQVAYANLVNQAHNAGLGADFVLPRGNGDRIDPNTAAIFARVSGWNGKGKPSPDVIEKARKAAVAKGWQF
jgi:hypothetical protein